MSTTAPQVSKRLGPFMAGSSPDELSALVQQGHLGLRILDSQEQSRDFYKAHCETLEKVAREFFYAYDGTHALILQKHRESPALPRFTEYIYCWFAENQLCGAILSGVTSDAGTHAQINEQEAALEEHAAEVTEALGRKYPESPSSFLNPFNFEIHSSPPDCEGLCNGDPFTRFERLPASDPQPHDATTRTETAYCGPGIIRFTGKHQAAELSGGTTHSHQAIRKGFASPDCLVIYDFKLERYVRTIESIHVYENLIYLSKALAQTLGSRLNAGHASRVCHEARSRIHEWRSTIERSEEAKRARIHQLSEIL